MHDAESPVRHDNQGTGLSFDSLDQLPHHDVGCLQRSLSLGQSFADRLGHRQPNDPLPDARHRHRPGFIVRIDSAADQWRIPDTPGQH